MKRLAKAMSSLGLAFILLFVQAAAAAPVSSRESRMAGEITTIRISYQPTLHAAANGLTAQSREAFYQLLLEQMLNRKENFTITYQGPLETVYSNLYEMMQEVYALPSSRKDAKDYLEYSCESMGVDISYNQTKSIFQFRADYFTNAAQETYVTQRIQSIIQELGIAGASDEHKITAVHQYICTHFSYDNTLTKYSAYAGLATGEMVCQGYALLFYRMMQELQIPARIISGTANGGSHAWNLVKLKGNWYNVDETWDSSASYGSRVSNDYFLKSMQAFPDHARDPEYSTNAFYGAYPVAAQSYDLSGGTGNGATGSGAVNLSGVSAWHQEELGALVQTGLVPEALLSRFQSNITRGELIALLVNLYESVYGTTPERACPFLDIGGHIYQREIAAAWYLGLTAGKSNTVFAPDDSLTRQEAAKLLCSLLECLGEAEVPQSGYAPVSYEDRSQIGSWAMPYVAYAAQYSIMSGDGVSFFPGNNLTREQGMAIVWRLLSRFSILETAA